MWQGRLLDLLRPGSAANLDGPMVEGNCLSMIHLLGLGTMQDHLGMPKVPRRLIDNHSCRACFSSPVELPPGCVLEDEVAALVVVEVAVQAEQVGVAEADLDLHLATKEQVGARVGDGVLWVGETAQNDQVSSYARRGPAPKPPNITDAWEGWLVIQPMKDKVSHTSVRLS